MKKPIVLLLLMFTIASWSQVQKNDQVNMDLFLSETQFSSNDSDIINLIWWIPSEYWEATFKEDKSISEKELAEMIDVMKAYNVLGIVQGEIGLFGGVTYEDADEIFKKTSLKDHYGDVHYALKREEISPDMNNFLDVMKPILSNMMGNLGENFSFLVFDAKNSSDKMIADSYKDHDFDIILKGDETYHFDLPFSALLMPKVCPKDSAEHNGKWVFCPYHGDVLKEKTPTGGAR